MISNLYAPPLQFKLNLTAWEFPRLSAPLLPFIDKKSPPLVPFLTFCLIFGRLKPAPVALNNYLMTDRKDQVPDDLNPQLLFQGVPSQLLIQLLQENTDLRPLIIAELKSRGLEPDGTESSWLTFTKKTFDIE